MGFRYFGYKCEEVRGLSHIKKGLPCEDSSGIVNKADYTIAAISDGHGTSRCCRSNRGSLFAVQSSLDSTQALIESIKCNNGGIIAPDKVESSLGHLKKTILYSWNEMVEADIREHPFSLEEEIKRPKEKYIQRYIAGVELQKMYGATLSMLCIAEDFWFAIQIGDGDVALRFPDGYFMPFLEDDEDDFVGEVTDSICEDDAITKMIAYYSPIDDEHPAPIAGVVNSDGISKSYPTYESQFRFYEGLFRHLVDVGLAEGLADFQVLLPHVSEMGSGDDLSLAGFIDMGANWIGVDDYRETSLMIEGDGSATTDGEDFSEQAQDEEIEGSAADDCGGAFPLEAEIPETEVTPKATEVAHEVATAASGDEEHAVDGEPHNSCSVHKTSIDVAHLDTEQTDLAAIEQAKEG